MSDSDLPAPEYETDAHSAARTREVTDRLTPTTDIADDNPFKPVLIDLVADQHSWRAIFDHLEEALDAADEAALKEETTYLPEYEIEMVMPDDDATSGERYETVTQAFRTEALAERWATDHLDAIRVERIDQIGHLEVL